MNFGKFCKRVRTAVTITQIQLKAMMHAVIPTEPLLVIAPVI